MRKYFRLFKKTLDVSTSVMLAYRSNVIFFIVFETFFTLSQFLTISVGFDLAGDHIGDWTKDEAFLVTAINSFSHQIFVCFFINPIFSIGQSVWNGAFDFFLLKPIHIFWSMFSLGQIVVSNFPSLVLNFFLVCFFAFKNFEVASLLGLTGFIGLAIIGVVVRVAVALACITPVFFAERLTDAEGSYWSLTRLAGYPSSIFPKSITVILTYIIPLGMLAYVPASAFFNKMNYLNIVLSLLASVIFVIVACQIFFWGVRNYKSVNSGN